MRGVVVHAPKDLRIDEIADVTPGPHEVRVRIAAGGICGSDLHYFNHGGTGIIRLQQPMVLGHEIAGVVSDLGDAVSGLAVGARVAINPSRPCDTCEACRAGLRNHCSDMRFMGSAMRFPHVQGGFREFVTVDESQVFPVGDLVSLGEATMAEPLAVCLHAVGRAGPLAGNRILVTGCGPIGILTIMAARRAGAGEIVATDIHVGALSLAQRCGATHTLDVSSGSKRLRDFTESTGRFDVHFEASGSASVLRDGLDCLRPRGILVQMGMGGDVQLPITLLVTREIDLRGTFRFDKEFGLAARLIANREIDVRPLQTASFPMERAREAFDLANDKSKSTKVLISFD
ncbi:MULTISPECIES: L-idonate 5-dehydrogenase [Mesorhizobium]|uniref:L-idonate 5-dehydrogenase n=1 Tax=Mesorhizobium denitrificans TaxID=2294114 RepID=A0A371XEA7_9HYPH|nr:MULTISPECIES: L-idonate 5-dehydrogenase [Mesorhizobium]RFC67567.1 L-idonate 5-dehydrogenase [Mesorhizobium denitrificans]